jgi:DNA repair exonuclease SbcCD ATPase subunit
MTPSLTDTTEKTLQEQVREQREIINRLIEKVGLDAAGPTSFPAPVPAPAVETAAADAPDVPASRAVPSGLETEKADLELALADIRLQCDGALRDLQQTIEQSLQADADLRERQAAIETANQARAAAEKELATALVAADQTRAAVEKELEVAIETANRSRAVAENDLEAARERLHAAEAEVANADAELEKRRAQREEVEQAVAEAHGVIAQAEPVRRNKADVEAKLAALAAKEAEYLGYRENHEAAQRLLARLWPDWLRDGALTSWREEIERAQFQADAPASAALLFAALHGYRAALRETSDTRALLDAVREVARRLYQWLKDLGKTETEAAEIAQLWAAGINRECEGKAEVEVPLPGDPADATWMSFRPGAGGTPVVLSVQTWCVRDAQKRPLNKALITA